MHSENLLSHSHLYFPNQIILDLVRPCVLSVQLMWKPLYSLVYQEKKFIHTSQQVTGTHSQYTQDFGQTIYNSRCD